ncbi:hypothetical protein LGN21_30510, partial [Burkholderia cepacia]|nr:hypothetical protein [Burkholderia cepacia]
SVGRIALIVTNLLPRSVEPGWIPRISTGDSLLNWLQDPTAGHFDLGPLLESAKVDPAIAVQREREMRIFIKLEIGEHLDLLRGTNPNPTRSNLDAVFQETLKMTFELFEAGL